MRAFRVASSCGWQKSRRVMTTWASSQPLISPLITAQVVRCSFLAQGPPSRRAALRDTRQARLPTLRAVFHQGRFSERRRVFVSTARDLRVPTMNVRVFGWWCEPGGRAWIFSVLQLNNPSGNPACLQQQWCVFSVFHRGSFALRTIHCLQFPRIRCRCQASVNQTLYDTVSVDLAHASGIEPYKTARLVELLFTAYHPATRNMLAEYSSFFNSGLTQAANHAAETEHTSRIRR